MELAKVPKRSFVKDDLKFDWESIKLYFDDLLDRKFHSSKELYQWLKVGDLGSEH